MPGCGPNYYVRLERWIPPCAANGMELQIPLIFKIFHSWGAELPRSYVETGRDQVPEIGRPDRHDGGRADLPFLEAPIGPRSVRCTGDFARVSTPSHGAIRDLYIPSSGRCRFETGMPNSPGGETLPRLGPSIGRGDISSRVRPEYLPTGAPKCPDAPLRADMGRSPFFGRAAFARETRFADSVF